jgi:hypothetical protein
LIPWLGTSRSRLAALKFCDIQEQEAQWVIADLGGEGNRNES